jgi:pentapeptide MXKDX repeat protein
MKFVCNLFSGTPEYTCADVSLWLFLRYQTICNDAIYLIKKEIQMNKFTSVLLSFCLAASANFAFAQDSMSMDKGAMSKDAMGKDTMGKDTMGKKKPMKKKSMKKDSISKDSMGTKDTMGKDKGM